MQSTVWHDWQVPGRRTRISSGDSVEAMKLNCPTGHTYLQKLAPANPTSMASAAAK